MAESDFKVMPIGYVLRKSAYEAYHGVIPLFLVGLVFSLVSLVILMPLLFGQPIFIWAGPLFVVPVWTAGVAVALPVALGQRPRFQPFFAALRRYLGRSLGLMALYLVMTWLVMTVWAFYRHTGGVAGMTFAIFELYAFAMFACAQLYTLPLMVKADLPVMKAIAMSTRLFLSHPMYTVAVLVQLASLAVVLSVTTVGLPLLFPGLAVVLLTNATLNLVGELPVQQTAVRGQEQ